MQNSSVDLIYCRQLKEVTALHQVSFFLFSIQLVLLGVHLYTLLTLFTGYGGFLKDKTYSNSKK